MLSPLGTWLRKYRAEKRMTLREMAKSIQVSAAYLSAVEVGRKSPTNKLIDAIGAGFELHKDEINSIRRAADKSTTKVFVESETGSDAELASVFARNFNHLSDAQKDNIRRILEG